MILLGEIDAGAIARAAFRRMGVSTHPIVERALGRLLVFAQRGEGSPPVDELWRVFRELFVPPDHEGVFDPMTVPLKLVEGPAGENADGHLVAVVLAARGRLRLAAGMTEVSELAALASCSTRHIRNLVDHGGLRRAGRAKRGPVAAAAAMAFLHDRKVPVHG